jgi:hypothetical protein
MELSAEEIVGLSTVCDVAIMNIRDPRTKKQKVYINPPLDLTPILALDVKGGRFRQR